MKDLLKKLDWEQVTIFYCVLWFVFLTQCILIEIPVTEVKLWYVVLPTLGMTLSGKYFYDAIHLSYGINKARKETILFSTSTILTFFPAILLLATAVSIMIVGPLPEKIIKDAAMLSRALNVYTFSIVWLIIYYLGIWSHGHIDNNFTVAIDDKVLHEGEKFTVWPFLKYDINVVENIVNLGTLRKEKFIGKTKFSLEIYPATMNLNVDQWTKKQIRKTSILNLQKIITEKFLAHTDRCIKFRNKDIDSLKKSLEEPFKVKFADGITAKIDGHHTILTISY